MRNLQDLLASYEQSTYRENVLEQLFCGELLQAAWILGYGPIEVDRPFVDFQGYDLVMTCKSITRHLQLKATKGRVSIHEALAAKRSGCVVNLRPVVSGAPPRITFTYDFFGGAAGKRPDVAGFKHAKKAVNTRQADGSFSKTERVHHLSVPEKEFERGLLIDQLLKLLFGGPPRR